MSVRGAHGAPGPCEAVCDSQLSGRRHHISCTGGKGVFYVELKLSMSSRRVCTRLMLAHPILWCVCAQRMWSEALTLCLLVCGRPSIPHDVKATLCPTDADARQLPCYCIRREIDDSIIIPFRSVPVCNAHCVAGRCPRPDMPVLLDIGRP